MDTKVNISDFTFYFEGRGHYKVTYKSPKTGRQWERVTNDMQLIDATKNADNPKKKDLQILKNVCKNNY